MRWCMDSIAVLWMTSLRAAVREMFPAAFCQHRTMAPTSCICRTFWCNSSAHLGPLHPDRLARMSLHPPLLERGTSLTVLRLLGNARSVTRCEAPHRPPPHTHACACWSGKESATQVNFFKCCACEAVLEGAWAMEQHLVQSQFCENEDVPYSCGLKIEMAYKLL